MGLWSAALNVATGEITGRHYRRRRRLEFLDFMNRMVKRHEGKEIHVILDNLSTHKPKRDVWLARHPNVNFHDTPIGSVTDLMDHIASFIEDADRSFGPRARVSAGAQTVFRGLAIPGTTALSALEPVLGRQAPVPSGPPHDRPERQRGCTN